MSKSFAQKTKIFYFPGTTPLFVTAKIKKFFKVIFRMYTELIFIIKETIINENKAAIEWSFKGFNISGKSHDNQGVTVLKIGKNHLLK